jgi:hypothetical protein
MKAPEITAARLKAYFDSFTWNRLGKPVKGGFSCDKMTRAWRNRSPVPSAPWWNFAHEVAGNTDYAGCLYAACGELAVDRVFTADSLTSEQLEKLAKIIVAYIRKAPEKALSRGQFDQHIRNYRNLCRDQICGYFMRHLSDCAPGEGPQNTNKP